MPEILSEESLENSKNFLLNEKDKYDKQANTHDPEIRDRIIAIGYGIKQICEYQKKLRLNGVDF